MERFAFKIDKALKANLYKICRLCGIDNPDKVAILKSQVVDVDGEPELVVKIKQLIGLQIMKNDKMPQEICSLCVDKINDYYEFREMCLATNVQTRKLLGLKNIEPKKEVEDIKPQIVVKEEPITGKRRGRKRKSELEFPMMPEGSLKKVRPADVLQAATQRRHQQLRDIQTKVQELQVPKTEIKTETDDRIASAKFKIKCPICYQGFSSKVKMEKHCGIIHVPSINRYMCVACNETIKKTNDIRNHQLWHKLTKTPYKCGACDYSARTLYQYSRHLREHCHTFPVTVLDRMCPQCGETFATNFLYNIHNCAAGTLTCGGCDMVQSTVITYRLHSAKCSKSYETYSHHIPDGGFSTESNVRIKNEAEIEASKDHLLDAKFAPNLNMTPMVSLERMASLPNGGVVSIPCDNNAQVSKPHKSNKLKQNLKRIDELIQSTMSTLASIKQEPNLNDGDDAEVSLNSENQAENDAENSNSGYEENCYDNDDRQSNSDNSVTDACLEVQLHIKEERQDDEHTEVNADTNNVAEKVPVLKLKIKKEHGSLSSSLVEGSTFNDGKRKKRKHRDTDKAADVITQQSESEDNQSINPEHVVIKQERIDEHEASQQISQLQIASIASGVEFGDKHYAGNNAKDFVEDNESVMDIKPNRVELDRLIASNVNSVGNNAPFVEPQSSSASMPRITAVQGGCYVNAFNGELQGSDSTFAGVRIKSEPLDEDEVRHQEQHFDMNTLNIKSEPMFELQALHLNDHQTTDYYQASSTHESQQDNPSLVANVTEQNVVTNQNIVNSISAVNKEFTCNNNVSNACGVNGDFTVNDNASFTSVNENVTDNGNVSISLAAANEENSSKESGKESSISVPTSKDDYTTSTITSVSEESSVGDQDNMDLTSVVKLTEEITVKNQESTSKTEKQNQAQSAIANAQIEDVCKEDDTENISISGESATAIENKGRVEATTSNKENIKSKNLESAMKNYEIATNASETNLISTDFKSSKELQKETSEIAKNNDKYNEKEMVSTSTESLTMSMAVVEAKEFKLKAQPIFDSVSIVSSTDTVNSNSIEMAEEVTENTLNQLLVEQTEVTNPITACVEATEGNITELASSSTSLTALQQLNVPPNEEADNLYNERHQMQMQQQLHHMCSLGIDDGNVNEIAENNNNANIERELRVEGVLRTNSDVDDNSAT